LLFVKYFDKALFGSVFWYPKIDIFGLLCLYICDRQVCLMFESISDKCVA